MMTENSKNVVLFALKQVPFYSSLLSKNILKRNIIELSSSLLVVLPSERRELILLQFTAPTATTTTIVRGETTTLQKYGMLSLQRYQTIDRKEHQSEMIRDVLVVLDLSSISALSAITTRTIDESTRSLADPSLNIFVLTKSCIEQYSYHTTHPDNASLVAVISIENIPNPKELHLIDSYSYQQRILLLVDNYGILYKYSLWKREKKSVVDSFVKKKQMDKVAEVKEEREEEAEEGKQEKGMTITAQDKIPLQEKIVKFDVFAEHFYEKEVAVILSSSSSSPLGFTILSAYQLFSTGNQKLKSRNQSALGSSSLDGKTERHATNNKDILSTSDFVLIWKDHISKPTVTTLSNELSFKDPLLATVETTFNKKSTFTHVLPGMNIHEALHVPTPQEMSFLHSLTNRKETIELTTSHQPKENSLSELQLPGDRAGIEYLAPKKTQNGMDTDFFQSLVSIPQLLSENHSSSSNPVAVEAKRLTANGESVVATIEIYTKDNETSASSRTTDRLEAVTEAYSLSFHSASSPSSLTQLIQEVSLRDDSTAIDTRASPHITLQLCHREQIQTFTPSDQWCTYPLSKMEVLLAIALHNPSSSSSAESSGETVCLVYYLDLQQLRANNSNNEAVVVYPSYSVNLSSQMLVHGLRFVHHPTSPLSRVSREESNPLSALSFSSTRKKDTREIPHLLAVGMKRTAKPSSSSSHIISISTEREYDYEIYCFPLPHDIFRKEKTIEPKIGLFTSLPMEQRNEREKEEETNKVQLSVVLAAIETMKASFETRLERIESKLSTQQQSIDRLESAMNQVLHNTSHYIEREQKNEKDIVI